MTRFEPPAVSGSSPAGSGLWHRRWVQIIGAAVLILIALVTLLYAVDHATLTYTLPPNLGSTEPNTHTQLWPPGLVAAVISGVAALSSISWLILVVLRRAPRRGWLGAAGLVLLAVLATLITGGMETPTF